MLLYERRKKEINLFFVLHFLRIKIEIVKKKTAPALLLLPSRAQTLTLVGEFEDANFALSKVIIGFCNAVVDVFKGFSALILMVVSTPTDAKSNV